MLLKHSLHLPYRGVQAVTGQGTALNGDSRVVDVALPPKVTSVPLVPRRPGRLG